MPNLDALKLPLRVEVDKDFGVVAIRYDDGALVGFNADIKSKDDLQQIVDIVNNYPKLEEENKRMREAIKKALAIERINKKDMYEKGFNFDYAQGCNNVLDYIQETILCPAIEEKEGE